MIIFENSPMCLSIYHPSMHFSFTSFSLSACSLSIHPSIPSAHPFWSSFHPWPLLYIHPSSIQLIYPSTNSFIPPCFIRIHLFCLSSIHLFLLSIHNLLHNSSTEFTFHSFTLSIYLSIYLHNILPSILSFYPVPSIQLIYIPIFFYASILACIHHPLFFSSKYTIYPS